MHRSFDGDSEGFGFCVTARSVARGLHGEPADHGHKLRVAWDRDREFEGAGVHATRRTG